MWIAAVSLAASVSPQPGGAAEQVVVAKDGKSFALAKSGARFVPWGFNYDHDERGRLLEDYWEKEWPKVESDFREMKQLGANVVRVHPQFGKFMKSAEAHDEQALKQLARLVSLAERVGLRLDVTGLGCYHKADVPAWYDALDEDGRWAAQARFWRAVAKTCARSQAIFCYDLMNEPVAPAGPNKGKDWLGPAFGDKHFVQWISLEAKGRERPAIAREWIQRLTRAIREVDERHLITVGLVPWSLKRPGLDSGFHPDEISGDLDFISVHLYPESGKAAETMETLRGFAVGKPVVIEETFPLKCSVPEFRQFLRDSKAHAAGWIGFYWGRTLVECRKSKTIHDALTAAWLEVFQVETKAMQR
ncbi:MAG: cellulase family glycosylhydrolase [Verrucomicrobia bacterium]|nr:cellulase family glycosylhydrolase [Verrucomicrobiota bacterium]